MHNQQIPALHPLDDTLHRYGQSLEDQPSSISLLIEPPAQAIRDYETLSQEILQYDPFKEPSLFPGMPKFFEIFLPQRLGPYEDLAPFVESTPGTEFKTSIKLKNWIKEVVSFEKGNTLSSNGSCSGVLVGSCCLVLCLSWYSIMIVIRR